LTKHEIFAKLKVDFSLKTFGVEEANMEQFSNLEKNKITYLKNQGNPVMGWSSIYTPEEIIYAAGIMPFRVTGESEPESIKARAILSGNICPYVLSCLEEGLQGTYDFMDGVVIVSTCDARRRLYDGWRLFAKTPFVHMIDLPRTITPESRGYFKNQFLLFKSAIEAQFKCKITEKCLMEAISLWNETRGLLNELQQIRKHKNPPVSGTEFLAVMKAGMSGDRKGFRDKLKDLLKGIDKKKETSSNKSLRVLITGSYLDQLSLVSLIEELGADVVCDDLSNGIKYFEGSVNINREPIESLAEYYLQKSRHSLMADPEERFKYLLELIKEYDVDAVIYFSLKFCDNNLIDFPYQKYRLQQHEIPVLALEGERALVNLHQIKTRVQAFIEMSEGI
jgi:benzoyl-CoA reductase/2-hydroxyglutaryl-CoA dehydratase subunit BcrC/BadD/HgdB